MIAIDVKSGINVKRKCQYRITARIRLRGKHEGRKRPVIHGIEHYKVVDTIPSCVSNCPCLMRPLSMLNSRLVVTDQTGNFHPVQLS